MQSSVAYKPDGEIEKTFGTELFTELFKPLQSAQQPPRFIYESPTWFDLERRGLFLKAWHFVCLASDLPEVGQFRSRSFVGTSIIVVRGEDRLLRAFFNTCRHRGAPLSNSETGRVKSFVCPFHGWAYRLDGQLFRAPGLDTDDQASLGRMGSNLIQLPCEIRENLVFINLDIGPAQSLDSFLGNYLTEVAQPHCTERMRCIHHRTYTLNANWKLYAEVDMETLHTPHIHRRSIGEQPVEVATPDGQWVGVFNRSSQTPALSPDDKDTGFPFVAGAYGKALQGTHFCIVLPGFFIVTAQDCMWWIQKTPIGPTEVEVDVGYCFPEETIEREDFETVSGRYIHRWNQVVEEDDLITEYQQKGLNARVSGRYTPGEGVVHELDKHIVGVTLRGGYE